MIGSLWQGISDLAELKIAMSLSLAFQHHGVGFDGVVRILACARYKRAQG